MPRIDNPQQLATLRVRMAQVEGAQAVAQAAAAAAETAARGYLEAVALLSGVVIGDGDRVRVDWDSGEVSVERQHTQNGVMEAVA